ncbi:ABC transporter permease [Nonomuraea sp. NPDC050310]|uniref:ABC transporter permease n=1 Tax=unclassified Nonomuraea TaxID=2593643 RepID=UPI0033CBCE62
MIDILRSEWTKLRSVRSTMWTFIVAAVLMIGFCVLISIAALSTNEPLDGFDAFDSSMGGSVFASIALATLGVLSVSSEYRTGMIRTSLQAVPQRLSLLAGKVLVFTAVTLVYSVILSFASFFTGMAILARENMETTLGAPGVLRALIGTALLLTASGLFGLALGSLIRHSPGAIVTAISMILIVPQLTNLLPGEWGRTVNEYMTTNAGNLVALVEPRAGAMGPWEGFAVYLAWIAAVAIAGAVLLKKRDA